MSDGRVESAERAGDRVALTVRLANGRTLSGVAFAGPDAVGPDDVEGVPVVDRRGEP